MTFPATEAFYLNGALRWGFSDVSPYDMAPVVDNVNGIGTRALRAKINGYLPSGIVAVSKVAGSAYASATAETNILGAIGAGSYTIAAAELNKIGTMLRFRASGLFATTGTPTIDFKFKLGSTIIGDSGVVTTTAASGGNFVFQGEFTVQTTGAAAALLGFTKLEEATSAGGLTIIPANTLQAAGAASIDLTAAQAITLTAAWGTNSASNTLTLQTFVCELFPGNVTV